MIYRVENGVATEIDDPTEASNVDWESSCLALAATADQALQMAEMFDAGELQPDNLAWGNYVIVALQI